MRKCAVSVSVEITNEDDSGDLVLAQCYTVSFDMNKPLQAIEYIDPTSLYSYKLMHEQAIINDSFPSNPTLRGYTFIGCGIQVLKITLKTKFQSLKRKLLLQSSMAHQSERARSF